MPDGGATQIISDTGYDIWELFETGSAFPSTVWLDHEMRVHDQMNNAGSWSIGIRMDEMLEACGSLCEDGGCTTTSGDVNEDAMLNIQDLITMVNHILGSSPLMDCALEAADMNTDGTVNIQDLITLVNTILGSARLAQLDGHAKIDYIISGNDMIIQLNSDVDVAGVELSFLNDTKLDIELKGNSHINENSSFMDGINRYLAYTTTRSFDSWKTELLIHSAGNLDPDNLRIIAVDMNGDILKPHSIEIANYPNPFNPSTKINYNLPIEDYVRLTAYDVRGQEVDVIFEGTQSVGRHSYTWNAANLPSGVYYIRLQAGDMITGQKALLIK